MKKYLFIPILLFAVNAFAAPSTLMSITPAATDGSVIEAGDENTRNSNVSTPYNAHTHTDITSVGNTLSLGDGTAGNNKIGINRYFFICFSYGVSVISSHLHVLEPSVFIQ